MREKREREKTKTREQNREDDSIGAEEPMSLEVVEALRRAREELEGIKDSILETRRETRYIMQTIRPRLVGVTIERLRPRNIIKRIIGR